MTSRAQTESIGMILLTAVVVATAATGGAIVLAETGENEATQTDVSVSIADDGVTVSHNGGESIPLDDLRVTVRIDDDSWRLSMAENGSVDGDDEEFELGERWTWTETLDGENMTAVQVFDTRTGTLLAEEREYPTDDEVMTPTPVDDDEDPNVTVQSPDGGEEFASRETTTIRWDASDRKSGVYSVDIAYSDDGGSSWNTVATGVTNDGQYEEWSVPDVDNETLLVRVTAIDRGGNTANDTSDAVFVVDGAPPTVTVEDPSGGETFIGDENTTIEWRANDSSTDVSDVDVSYSTTNGSTWRVAASDISDDGSYNWTVPEIDTDEALVRVRATDAVGNFDENRSGTFTIDTTTGLSNPSVSDLIDDQNAQNQAVSFTVDNELSADETVTINLSEPQDANGGVNEVDYRDASVDNSTVAEGGVTVDADTDNATVTFDPDQSISAGENISFTINGVATAAEHSAEHSVVFSRSDRTGSEVTTFVVKLSGGDTIDGDHDGDVYSDGDVTVEEGGQINGNVTTDGSVTVGEGDINGSVTADGDVSLNEGGTINGTVTSGGTITINEDAALDGNASSNGSLTIAEGGEIDGDLEAGSSLDVAGPVNGTVTADGDVSLNEDGTVSGDLTSDGSVSVNEGSALGGNLTSNGSVTVNEGAAVDGDLDADGAVSLSDSVNGTVTTTGDVTLNEGGTAENVDTDGDVQINEDGTVTNNVTSDGTVTINEGGTVEGHVNVDSAEDINCNEGARINGQPCQEYVDENYEP